MRSISGLTKAFFGFLIAAGIAAVFVSGAKAGEQVAADSTVLALNVAASQSGCGILPASAVIIKSKRRCRVGSEIDLSAKASGGSRCYEYCFWLEGPAVQGKQSVQGYSSSDDWHWEPAGEDVGVNSVTVWVRSIGSPNEFDACATYNIEVIGD